MRTVLCLFVLLGASDARGQDTPDHRADSTDVLVLSVLEQDGGYVYDLDGRDESEAYIYGRVGVFVVRAADVGTAIVVLEPDGWAGPTTAVVLTPEHPAAVIDQEPLDVGYGVPTPSGAGEYRVTVIVCTQGDGEACEQWETAAPRSGGSGLILTVVPGPELGPTTPDPPVRPFDPR